MPPAPVVVEWAVVQSVPFVDSSMRYAEAWAASQRSSTRSSAVGAPRSTCSHWSSEKALDQRVPRSPSTAAAAAGPFAVPVAVM